MDELNEKVINEAPATQTDEPYAEPAPAVEMQTEAPSEMSEMPADPAPSEEPEEKPVWSFAAQNAADKEAAKKAGRKGALVYAIVMTGLFAVCFGILAALLITGFGSEGTPVYIDNSNVADLVESVIDGVVTVSVTTKNGAGFGSGFVYTDDGYIITNYHVIDDAVSITVLCNDGRELPAELIDGDELSDVAVIRVKNLGIRKLAVGDSDALRVGEDVIAIGTPVDLEYSGTVTKGIISGVKRRVHLFEESGLLEKTMELIQTDATLNHGNSGGPMFNMRGEVIGINTLKHLNLETGDEMGFAIPINDVVEIAEDIIEDGSYSGDKGSTTKGVQLGISCGTVKKGVETKITDTVTVTPEADGVIVTNVVEGSVCEGKLELYDIIVSFDGVKTATVDIMRAELYKHKIGDKVILEVYRNGSIINVEITL